MPVFVDPKTGERYDNVPEDEQERARSEFGFITPEEYADRQKAEEEGVVGGFAQKLVEPVVGLTELGMRAGILDKGTPEEQAQWQESLARFGRSSKAHEAVSPGASLAGNVTSMGVLGTASAGAGSALAGAAGAAPALGAGLGLLSESAVTGVAQEAVDSVTTKRDFSAKAALWNGGLNLALGGLGSLAGHYGGKLLGFGDEAADVARRGAPAATPDPDLPGRNWLGEIDPGEVPEAIGGARRARAAGAAAAENAPYRAGAPEASGARAAESPGAYRGAGVNDTEPFADDVWDAAAKSFDEGGPGGKAMEREARFLADPATAKNLTDLGAMNVADNLDTVRKVLRDDASLAAKNDDFARMATEWTPEQNARRAAWVEGDMAKAVDDLSEHIQATRAAAGDVRAGRQGPRVGGADAVEAGGFDSQIQKTLRTGLDRIRRAEGAEQAIAIDGLKREIGGTVREIGRSRTLDAATKAERTGKLVEFYQTLQQGLESEDLFGRMGSLQKATNEATTRLIEPFQRIEAKFSERLGDTWGQTGQQAINRETKASAVASMLRASPLEQREFMRALDDGLSAADDLIAARQAHGITHLDDLEAAKRGLEEIRNEFRFARVLKAAERRAGEATTGLGQAAAEAAVGFAARRIPIVGDLAAGQGKSFLRNLANAAEMPKPGTPLGDVLSGRLKAYARNPDLADAGFSRTLPQWLQTELRVDARAAAARARELIDRRRSQAGSVEVGQAKDWFKERLGKEPNFDRIFGDNILPFDTAFGGRVAKVTAKKRTVQITFGDAEESGLDIQRTFGVGKGGIPYVQHDRFFLPSTMKGQGLAKRYLREAVAEYRDLGIKEIRLPEAAADGRVVWAKLGFEPSDPETAKYLARKFRYWLQDLENKRIAPDGFMTHDLAVQTWGPDYANIRFKELDAPISLGEIVKHPDGEDFLRGIENGSSLLKDWRISTDDLANRLAASEAGNVGLNEATVMGILGSPMGATIAAGAIGLGAHKAYQLSQQELLPEQRKAREGLDAQLSVMPPDQQQQTIRTAEAFARIQHRTEQRVQGAVTDLFSLAKNPRAEPRHRSPEARALDTRASELDVPRHLARFMGRHDDPVAAFRDKARQIDRLVADPAALARSMAQNLGDLPRQQPEIFASMVGQTMAVVSYLHERKPGNSGKSALDPGGYPPSFEEISEWAGHWVGATAPLDTLDDLASNELVPEQMEAVQALHGDAYAMFQTTAMRQIHELSRKRGPIPIEALEQIDSALSLDGAGEPILSSAMAGLIQQANAQEQERLKAQAQEQQSAPMVSQSPSRLASSALGSLHAE